MSGRRAMLWVSLAVAAAAIALSLLDAAAWLRAPFGLAIVTLVPGHALIEALDPKLRLGGMERFALAVGTSIAVSLVTGLLLSASPAGLQAVTWSAGLGGFSIVACLAALHATRDREASRAVRTLPRRWRGVLTETGIVLGLTTALALALTSVAATGTLGSEQSVEEGRGSVLQLWALPDSEGTTGSIEVGVENPTGSHVECVLIARQGQTEIAEEPLLLEPDDTYTLRVQPVADASIMFPLEVVLTDTERIEILRRVAVWPSASTYLTNQAADPEG